MGGKLQQSLVARYGAHTEARLREDPYSALFPISGVSFRCARRSLPPSSCLVGSLMACAEAQTQHAPVLCPPSGAWNHHRMMAVSLLPPRADETKHQHCSSFWASGLHMQRWVLHSVIS